MYEDFLRSLLIYIEALNAAEKRLAETGIDLQTGIIASLTKIPVECCGEVVGYIVDEIGGQWSYQAGGEA